MFFYLSKILWFIADPGNLFLLLLFLGAVMRWMSIRKLGNVCFGLAALLAVTVTFLPVGAWAVSALENRFEQPDSTGARIDGIIVLGGVIDPTLSTQRGQTVIGGAVERITVSADLARRHRQARVLYTGGSGSVLNTEDREADHVSALYRDLGLSGDRLVLERNARNTHENALYGRDVMQPELDENWLLVTSAFRMPRAVGVFRAAGWPVIPYPVDYSTAPDAKIQPPLNFREGLNLAAKGLREWIGLLAYWLTGKTNTLFPEPYLSEPT